MNIHRSTLLVTCICLASLPLSVIAQTSTTDKVDTKTTTKAPVDNVNGDDEKTPKLKVTFSNIRTSRNLTAVTEDERFAPRIYLSVVVTNVGSADRSVDFEPLEYQQAKTDTGEIIERYPGYSIGLGNRVSGKLQGQGRDALKFFTIVLRPPVKPANLIAEMHGQFTMNVGVGQTQKQTLESFPDNVNTVMRLPELPRTPIVFSKLAKNDYQDVLSVKMDPALLHHMKALRFYDATGKQLMPININATNEPDRFAVILNSTQKVSVEFEYYPTVLKYQWALALSNIPMPLYARWDVMPEASVKLLSVTQSPAKSDVSNVH